MECPVCGGEYPDMVHHLDSHLGGVPEVVQELVQEMWEWLYKVKEKERELVHGEG